MSAEWKPGDVAMVQISSAHGPEIAVSSDRQWFVAGPRLGSQHGWYHDRVTVIRPLVVIDPEDREQVEVFGRLLLERDRVRYDLPIGPVADDFFADMQAALREFANPAAPKREWCDGDVIQSEDSGLVWFRENGKWTPANGALGRATDFEVDAWVEREAAHEGDKPCRVLRQQSAEVTS